MRLANVVTQIRQIRLRLPLVPRSHSTLVRGCRRLPLAILATALWPASVQPRRGARLLSNRLDPSTAIDVVIIIIIINVVIVTTTIRSSCLGNRSGHRCHFHFLRFIGQLPAAFRSRPSAVWRGSFPRRPIIRRLFR